MIGKKVWLWLLEHKGQWIIKRATFNQDDWSGSTISERDKFEEGRLLTEAELEQLIRRAVEMARDMRSPYEFEQLVPDIVKELMNENRS